MGKPTSAYKKKDKPKSPVSPVWLCELASPGCLSSSSSRGCQSLAGFLLRKSTRTFLLPPKEENLFPLLTTLSLFF